MTTVTEKVEENFDGQLIWLKQLVADYPSCTDHKKQVEEAASFVDKIMTDDLNFHCKLEKDTNNKRADHRIYSSSSTKPKDKVITLVGHIDTVYPEHWDLEEKGGRLKGPGVMDMKGGLSVIVFALKALMEAEPIIFGKLKLRIIMNTDEEKGSKSSRQIYSRYSDRMTKALVFEPGRDEDKIVTLRKGSAPFDVRAVGEDAHAGLNHRDGSNAFHALMLVGHSIEKMTNYEKGITFNVIIDDKEKYNVGMSRNVVPKTASIFVDCRYESDGDADNSVQSLREKFSNWDEPLLDDMRPELSERVRKVSIEFDFDGEGETGRPPMNDSKGIDDLLEEYGHHAIKHGLSDQPAPRQGGVSDANYIAAHGVPVIDGLGPYGKSAHVKGDEWMDIESLKNKTKALASFLQKAGNCD